MPKTSKLAQLLPNKSYSVEGTLKFVHQSEDFITAVLQQDSVQKKIKIPASQKLLQEGKFYKFKNCFYNSNDWLMVRKPENSIQPFNPEQIPETAAFSLTLKQIKENFEELSTKYFSTFLKVYAIQPKQVLKKEGKDIEYQTIKAYSTQCLIDVTIWNSEVNVDHILDQWVLFEGVKIKKMTEDKFVLVSTVFSRLSIYQWEINDWYNPEMVSTYHNLSQIYQRRSLIELQHMEIPQAKIFSMIKAKVKSIVSADYEGCPKCRKKIENRCDDCGITTKAKYSYGKVILEEGEGSLEVIVFEQKIRELFKFAKEKVMIEGKVKTFGRVEEGENVISHILTKVDSIFF